jgi:hypothetical protein
MRSSKELVPMMAAALIAMVGAGMLVFIDFDPKTDVQGHGITMITTSVVERAGATALPTEPTASLAWKPTAG